MVGLTKSQYKLMVLLQNWDFTFDKLPDIKFISLYTGKSISHTRYLMEKLISKKYILCIKNNKKKGYVYEIIRYFRSCSLRYKTYI